MQSGVTDGRSSRIEVKELSSCEIPPAMALVWQVFSEFEAPEYSTEGVEAFRSFIASEAVISLMDLGEIRVWGAFAEGELCGVLAEYGAGHISLFFVRKEYHRRGIGRALFARYADACTQRNITRITVNSSLYAVPVYHKLGFADTDTERLQNGIRYIPMERTL